MFKQNIYYRYSSTLSKSETKVISLFGNESMEKSVEKLNVENDERSERLDMKWKKKKKEKRKEYARIKILGFRTCVARSL